MSAASDHAADTGPDPRREPIPWASLVAILAAIGVTGAALGLTSPLFGILMNDMGISGQIIGLNTMMPAIATVVATPVAPLLIRRMGFVPFILTCLLATAALLFAYKQWENIWVWFVLRFLLGATLAGVFVATEVWINLLAPEHRRGRILGIYGTALSAGFVVGVGLLSLMGSEGWPPFIAAIALLLAASVTLAPARGKDPKIAAHDRPPLLPFLVAAPTAMMGGFTFGAAEMGYLNLLPVYGARVGLSEGMATGLLFWVVVGNLVWQIPVGMLADRIDRRLVSLACAVVALIGVCVTPLLLSELFALNLVQFIVGGAVVGLYTMSLVLLGERFRGGALAASQTAFVMFYGLGSMVGPPFTGGAMDWWDPHGLMAALAVLLGAYVLIAGWRAIVARRRPLDPAAGERLTGEASILGAAPVPMPPLALEDIREDDGAREEKSAENPPKEGPD